VAELFNKTPFDVKLIPLIDKDGRNVAVLIAKATFAFNAGGKLAVVPEQKEVVFQDEHLGDPAVSDIRIPSDLVDFKPATDVIVVRPAAPLSGTELDGQAFNAEIGPVRFSGRLSDRWPFGPLRRDENTRKQYAGTYDQNWVSNRMPLLPEDFDPRHNLSAPRNQIAASYFDGSEHVKLTDIYFDAGRHVEFDLPGKVIFVAGNVTSRYYSEVARLDTVLIWVDVPQISLVWRYGIYPRQKIAEVRNVFVHFVRLRSVRDVFGIP
jgi:hypothetical protein